LKSPRGWTRSKAEAKWDASLLAMMEKIKTLLADKEVSSEKRGERKQQEKEKTFENYYDLQTKKLDIEEINSMDPKGGG
jgi:hypothetical protein